MNRRSQLIRWIWIIFCLVFSASTYLPAKAQVVNSVSNSQIFARETAINDWSQPVNLSRSGAASQPRIVASPDNRLQAFWIDKFDGLTTAIFDGASWSTPAAMPIAIVAETYKGSLVSEVPYLISDTFGRIHAFYYGRADPVNGSRPLYYSYTLFGQNTWATPILVAVSAPVFSVALSTSGDLYVAFLRTLHSSITPAGIYFIRTVGSGRSWLQPTPIVTSIYYRTIPLEKARLDLANSGQSNEQNNEMLYLAWDDPRLQQTYLSHSSNSGLSWTGPELFTDSASRTANPSLIVLPQNQGLIRIWQVTELAGCTLQQQLISPSFSGVIVSKLDTTSTELAKWVLSDLNECPANQDFFPTSWNQGMLWVWNQGTPQLDLAIWQSSQGDWKQLESLSFNFLDPDVRRTVLLDDLHATLVGDRLAVIGSSKDLGDVWVTIGTPISSETEPSAGQPLWSNIQRLSFVSNSNYDPSLFGPPTIGINQTRQVFVVWGQPSTKGTPSLFYSSFEGAQTPTIVLKEITTPVEIFTGDADSFNRQPSMIVAEQADQSEDGLLHMVWSGGKDGAILYSRASSQQAGTSSGWLPSMAISEQNLSSSPVWPQIGMDDLQRLYAIYVLPLNEKRGVYLVRSDDGGNTWTKPTFVFDASAENWHMVDHPTLAVTPNGELHVAWVHQSLPNEGSSLGIFYTRSPDQGHTWTEPIQVVQAGFDWPRLVMAGGQLHLLYAKTADNSLWHRWKGNASQGSEAGDWSTPTFIPAWKNLSLPYGVAASGNRQFAEGVPIALYIAAIETTRNILLFSTWDGEHWSDAETYQPPAQVWESFSSAPQTGVNPTFISSVSATTRPEGGMLALAWWQPMLNLTQLSTLASKENQAQAMNSSPGVSVISRAIPAVELPLATPLLTATPIPALTAEASPTLPPTATPSLSTEKPPVSSPISPQVLGGGLAAIIVVAIFISILSRRRRQ